MTIHIDLDLLLVKRKMKLKDLADQVGITQANMSILKNGKTKAIRLQTLNTICRVLQCTPGDVLRYEEDEDPPRAGD